LICLVSLIGDQMPEKLDATNWDDIRARFAVNLCHIYCEVKNKATGRTAFNFGNFQLADGSLSPYYFDFRTIYAYPKYLEEIAEMMIKCVEYNILGFDRSELKSNPSPIQRIAGIPNASLGLATLVSVKLNIPSLYCHMKEFYYNEPKYAIQGSLERGDHVLVIDDLTTTALRKTETIDIIEKNGGQVSHSVVIIDRQEGAEEKLRERGIGLLSLLKTSEFATIARNENLIDEKQKERIIAHIRDRRAKDGLSGINLK